MVENDTFPRLIWTWNVYRVQAVDCSRSGPEISPSVGSQDSRIRGKTTRPITRLWNIPMTRNHVLFTCRDHLSAKSCLPLCLKMRQIKRATKTCSLFCNIAAERVGKRCCAFYHPRTTNVLTNQGFAGCKKLLQKEDSSSTFCNKICTCWAQLPAKGNLV